jgi:hypothetical protein
VTTRGVLFVHAAPSALCPHVEWAAAGVLGVRINLAWTPQPAAPGTYRSELSWQHDAGTAARLASALRGWQMLRYEVTEEPSTGHEGARYSYTPELGIFHAVTGPHGDLMIPEDRLRAALLKSSLGEGALDAELQRLLGREWDAELEPFRYAGDGAPVRWLHQVV